MENTYSVIDVGTNNVLLLIASVTDRINVIERDSRISALGKDMKEGWLDVEAVEHTKLILTEFIEQAHKYSKWDCEKCSRQSCVCVNVSEDKNQADKTKNNSMSCRHVGKETNHQYKRFCEYTHDLNNGHQWEGEF